MDGFQREASKRREVNEPRVAPFSSTQRMPETLRRTLRIDMIWRGWNNSLLEPNWIHWKKVFYNKLIFNVVISITFHILFRWRISSLILHLLHSSLCIHFSFWSFDGGEGEHFHYLLVSEESSRKLIACGQYDFLEIWFFRSIGYLDEVENLFFIAKIDRRNKQKTEILFWYLESRVCRYRYDIIDQDTLIIVRNYVASKHIVLEPVAYAREAHGDIPHSTRLQSRLDWTNGAAPTWSSGCYESTTR